MPTILDAAGIEQPTQVNGVEQQPIEGISMRYTFDDGAAPSRRRTQYFEILGNRAIYHDGWVAACFHGRVPWIRSQALPVRRGASAGSCTASPTTSARAATWPPSIPSSSRELQALFDQEARRHGVYPLSDQTTMRALPHNRPSLLEGRTRFTLYRDNVRMPELAAVNLKNTSFDLRARPAGAGGRRRGRGHLPGRPDGRLVALRAWTADRPTSTTWFGRELTT